MKKVLLYSGGTDSWLIDKIWKPDVLLYVDMGTMYSKAEIEKLSHAPKDILDRLVISDLPLGQFEDKKTAFIPMRNLYLLMHATNFGEDICLGATLEDAGGSSDKDVEFLIEAEQIIKRLWKKQSLFDGKDVRIEKRFARYTKGDLLTTYLLDGGNIDTFKNESFSCYSPIDGKECLMCKACFRKFVVCYENGAHYTEEELKRVYRFAEENVVHRSHHARGRYFMDKENGSEVYRVLSNLYSRLGKRLELE